MYFDTTYIIYVLPALIFTIIAQAWVNSAHRKAVRQFTARGYTGAQIAERILANAGVSGVRIEACDGKLSDHFDPRSNVVRLSYEHYSGNSIAAAGIAAHECGHAIQYAKGYFPLKVRNAIIPISQFGSSAAMPLILVGLLLNFEALITVGILFFAAAVAFQLITLPVEFNASRRAMKMLSEGAILQGDELPKARRVLTAAAMTYVAALAVAVMQLLRLIVLFGRRNND